MDWAPNFALYQVGDLKYSALKDGMKSIFVGQCKVKSFKALELVLCAPNKGGTYPF